MHENLHSIVKEIVTYVNKYAQTRESQYMEKIEQAIQILFESQRVKFWKVDIKKETIQLLI